jgi:hypothetical protein
LVVVEAVDNVGNTRADTLGPFVLDTLAPTIAEFRIIDESELAIRVRSSSRVHLSLRSLRGRDLVSALVVPDGVDMSIASTMPDALDWVIAVRQSVQAAKLAQGATWFASRHIPFAVAASDPNLVFRRQLRL